MKKVISRSLIVLISGLTLVLYSCTPQTCFDETESLLKASFYDYKLKTKLAPDTVTMYGLNGETNKIYDNALKLEPALIPLNSAADSCVIIIRINGINDTVTFKYTSYPHLISKECGYTFYHNLDTNRIFTRHTIDSIHIKTGLITTLNGENIQIYY